jgi:hypothetical protein
MNPFEKLVFLLGCIALAAIAFVVLLAIIAIVALAIDKINRYIWECEAKEKTVASEPVDGTDWLTYDCDARVKEVGDELRKMSEERGKGNGL